MNHRWTAIFEEDPTAAPSTFVIAEAGVNHNGNLARALEMIDAAAAAQADAVKFQTFRADRLASAQAAKAHYQQENTGGEENQHAMLKPLELSEDDHRALIQRCRERDILFLSTPFDEASADLLLHLGVAGFKLGSGDITNLPLLEHLALTGRPLILSTGMSTLPEVEEAVETVRGAGCRQLALLHCVTSYPSPAGESNLRVVPMLARHFGIPAGFSDHTLGTHVAVAAVTLGARIIEKHFTLDRDLPGPDHRASAVPQELELLVRQIRETETALGDGEKRVTASEKANLAAGRRSLFWAASLPAGSDVERANVICLRPATGLAPRELRHLLGRRLLRPVTEGKPVSPDDFA